jgi:protocatechuate 3,4-dioxygenase, beta subunit
MASNTISQHQKSIMSVIELNTQPPHLYPEYKSTILRSPTKPLVPVAALLKDLSLPAYGEAVIGQYDNDLTKNAQINGEPIGERIKVGGKVMDEYGKPLRNVLVEIWQANAAGRYIHKEEIHNAPLDPNFSGGGRMLTNDEGYYQFYTIKPGAYPWGNHFNAWRPNHIHFSVMGHQFQHRLITQMYFPGDPLFEFDPIFQSVPAHARHLMIAKFRMDWTDPEFALAYEFNIVMSGASKTIFE